MDVVKLISNIPSIIVYIAPGMIFLTLFEFITNLKSKKENTYFVWSIAISFIIVSLLKFFTGLKDIVPIAGFSIIISIVVAIISGYICIQTKFQKFIVWSGINKTIHDSIWDEIIDDYDVYLKLYIPSDKVYYYGLYKGHDEKDDNPYVLLTDYEVRDYQGNILQDGETLRSYNNNRTRWATINVKDVSSVEIIYSERSERNKKIVKC